MLLIIFVEIMSMKARKMHWHQPYAAITIVLSVMRRRRADFVVINGIAELATQMPWSHQYTNNSRAIAVIFISRGARGLCQKAHYGMRRPRMPLTPFRPRHY